jgi:hypothetical protein
MKLLRLLALLPVLALFAAAESACVPAAYSRPTLAVKHDRFRPDGASVQLSVPDGAEVAPFAPGLIASAMADKFDLWLYAPAPHGGVVQDKATFQLSHTSSNGWEYLKCHPLVFLIDGQTVDVGETEHDGSVEIGYVTEDVEFTAPLTLLDAMGHARLVEGKLCNTEFTFTPETLRLFRDFVKTVRTGVVPPQPVAPPEGALSM